MRMSRIFSPYSRTTPFSYDVEIYHESTQRRLYQHVAKHRDTEKGMIFEHARNSPAIARSATSVTAFFPDRVECACERLYVRIHTPWGILIDPVIFPKN